jgi:hypothetical protein
VAVAVGLQRALGLRFQVGSSRSAEVLADKLEAAPLLRNRRDCWHLERGELDRWKFAAA